MSGRSCCKCLSLPDRYPLASDVVTRSQQTSSPVSQRWMARSPLTSCQSARSTSLPDSTPSLSMVLISHTKPSLANHLLLPRAPCRGPLKPAALCLARRDHSRIAASSARSRRRAHDSSPLSIKTSASRGTGLRCHLHPRVWTHLFAASSSPVNVSADFSSVCHFQAGPPQHPAPSSWSSRDGDPRTSIRSHCLCCGPVKIASSNTPGLKTPRTLRSAVAAQSLTSEAELRPKLWRHEVSERRNPQVQLI